MKRILYILFLLPLLVNGQIKVKDLPETTTGKTGWNLILDTLGAGGTRRISVANFKTTYKVHTGTVNSDYIPIATSTNTFGNSPIKKYGSYLGLDYGSSLEGTDNGVNILLNVGTAATDKLKIGSQTNNTNTELNFYTLSQFGKATGSIESKIGTKQVMYIDSTISLLKYTGGNALSDGGSFYVKSGQSVMYNRNNVIIGAGINGGSPIKGAISLGADLTYNVDSILINRTGGNNLVKGNTLFNGIARFSRGKFIGDQDTTKSRISFGANGDELTLTSDGTSYVTSYLGLTPIGGSLVLGNTSTDYGQFTANSDQVEIFHTKNVLISPILTSIGVRPTDSIVLTGKIRFNNGTQGVGKVWTSDANGVGSWQTGGGGGSGTVTSVATGFGLTGGTITTTGTIKIDTTTGNLNGARPATQYYVNANYSPKAGSSSLTTTGTITSGTWNGTKISEAYGGTNQSTYTTGDMLYASATNTLSKLSAVASGSVLASAGTGTAPAYTSSPTLTTSLTTPLLIGGTGTTSTLTFKTTTGVGTTGSDFIWQQGNNGATETMRLLNSGLLAVGKTSAVLTGDLICASKNYTGETNITVSNTGSSNGAYATHYATNGTTNCYFGVNGTGNTGGGIFGTANLGYMGSGNAAGFAIAAANASGALHFYAGGSASANEVININSSGRLYVGGSTSATALLHLKAGTATASTAPLKLTTGTSNTTAEAGALEYTTPQLFFTNGGGQRQEIPQIQQSRTTSGFNKTNTTLADVTGLTAAVVAGKTYRFEAKLYLTVALTGGIKTAIGGTATATSFIGNITTFDSGDYTIQLNQKITALGGSSGIASFTDADGYVEITGTITVNAAGTLTVQAAQNSASGTSTVLTGSTFVLTEMN